MGRKGGKKKKTMPVRHPHPKRSISSMGETEFTEVKRIFKTLKLESEHCYNGLLPQRDCWCMRIRQANKFD